ncbi:MAG TPA: hypothetical protein VJY54_02760, partial [Lachnospiraceae bacterium]|nr:hypothetical protein [Lachnospiraceae bacterium]
MEYIDWKESDINKINVDKKWLISENLCICFEELASYLFLYQTEECIEEEIVKKIIQISEDILDQKSSQAIDKYIGFKKTKDTGSSITFSRVEYKMYFLSSWITRNLCKIACNEGEHSFDDFFVKNFSKATLLQKNLEILQKFSKQMKDY